MTHDDSLLLFWWFCFTMVVRHEVMRVAAEGNAAPPALPEDQPISNSQDQMLVQQLAETIKVIGDRLDQDQAFNDMIDGLVKVADKSSFWKLVEKVFTDDQINWGRIIVLFYSVGKLSAKMVLAHLPRIVSDILTLCLDYFRRNLLEWIRKVGGWKMGHNITFLYPVIQMHSIPALACFSFEQFSGSSLRKYFPYFGAMFSFTCGLLLGGFIISKLQKS
ncbi:BCL2 associated X, apoptosis regulator b isoform X2 [Megalobrama amblycephala]|uniref:BCL2 associated X, apoptosis regulator b isoform X2 n=1 Tax=Megalobrama amblycephala TaxID=75352 RepID=UPI002013E623|nr:BCL2 associated X, apoptosis regulator b isoform X2 [Megalobrama amblycephala]